MIQLSQGQTVYQVVKNLPDGVTQFRVRSEDAATSFDSFNSAEFLGELQSGSEIAFHRLFDGLQSPVCHFLTNTMGIPESDVGDVYVDALMKVHGNIHKFKCGGPAKLTTWIYGIARNEAIDYHRASKKSKTLIEFAEATVRHSQGTDGACAGRNADLLKWLEQELAKLPELSKESRAFVTAYSIRGELPVWWDSLALEKHVSCRLCSRID